MEISSKNDNSKYKYFHMIKLGTTFKKNKNIAAFFIFYAKNFEKNILKKLSINWRYRGKTIILDISTVT